MNHREIYSFLADCQSVEKIKMVGTQKVYIFKKRAVLNKSGNPIPLDEFMALEREYQKVPDFKKTANEKAVLKDVKASYEANMRAFLGKNWKVLSNSKRVFNVPTKAFIRERVLKSMGSSV